MVARRTVFEILRDGWGDLPPGNIDLSEPVSVRAGVLRGHSFGTRLVARFTDGNAVEVLGGALEALEIVGGWICVNVHNFAQDVRLSRLWLRDAQAVGLMVARARATLVRDVVVETCGDNGIQIDQAQDVEIISAVLLGPFGNKALDCTHRGEGIGNGPRRVRLRHLTVLDPHGYGIGLDGWRPGEGHVLANCLVLEQTTGAGASGYAVRCSSGPSAGTFSRNLANSTNPARARIFPGLEACSERELSARAMPSNLVGLQPNQFRLGPIPNALATAARWNLLSALIPKPAPSPLWPANVFWTTRLDVRGNPRRWSVLFLEFGAVGALA